MRMPNLERKITELDRKKDSLKIKNKSSEDRDAYQRVFDGRTISNLRTLLNSGKIQKIVGIISQGKEANVYFAYGREKIPLAIKIYKIDIQSARWMKNYIIGDPRFKKIGTSPDKIIYTWCKKEFRNLKQIYGNNLLSPEPLFFKANILIMTYIGQNNGTPAKKLKDSITDIKDPVKEMELSIQNIKDLYQKAKLVHGDLSEYNILYFENKQYLIDVSQAVSIQHPKAKTFLVRDIKNIYKFYEKLGVKLPDPLDLFYEIIENE